MDSGLPAYSPHSVPLTSAGQGVVTQGDRLNQLKRDRTQYKSASAGVVR